jgi:hypothetical protein
MSQIRKNARKFAAIIGLCSVAFVAVPLAGSSVSAETAPVFAFSTNIETVAQCASLVGYTISSTGVAVTSFSISPAAPNGLTFSSTTGLLSGKPEVVAVATIYTVTGTNSAGSSSKTFTLTVTQPTSAGIYPSCQKVSGTVGTPLTATVKYTDIGVQNEYNFTISPALPTGLTINDLTGVISGTPTQVTPTVDWVYTVRMDEEDTDLTYFATVTLTIYPAAAVTTTTVAPTTTTTVAPTTTTTVAVAKKTTIVCTKGSTIKRVTGLSPKCPVGYKKKTK